VRIQNALKSKVFPHAFAVLQLAFLVLVITLFADSPLATGGHVDHALKVIMPLDLWILGLSVTLFALFYKIRGEGIEERWITLVSLAAVVFSTFNLVLSFIDGLLMLEWTVKNVASALYLTVPMLGIYKMSIVLLLPRMRRVTKRPRGSKQDYDG
jgi:hypothetical protein